CVIRLSSAHVNCVERLNSAHVNYVLHLTTLHVDCAERLNSAHCRLKGLAREIHMIHDSHFKNTDKGEIRLVVGFRNNPNIEFELSRKRPASSILRDPLAKNMETSSDPTYLLPDYSKLSDSQFTQVLLTSAPTIMNKDKLIELLNQKHIFVFIRQLTQLINKLNCSKLQHEQWSYYSNLGLTEGIWNGRVSKTNG
ncbi:unnamed protein product, partial [Rotaria sp. Silwood1]